MELSTMCLYAALQSHLSCISQFLSPKAQNTDFFSQLVISNIYTTVQRWETKWKIKKPSRRHKLLLLQEVDLYWSEIKVQARHRYKSVIKAPSPSTNMIIEVMYLLNTCNHKSQSHSWPYLCAKKLEFPEIMPMKVHTVCVDSAPMYLQ